ncbi:hypothetical protein LBW59_08145 [Ralstonia solanacearum]|uniref:Lipoprotein n=1 Tax=Ralstonia solanacearum TaxID=305 RepID=A0AAW5ZL52_RALSL|nr:hypothetical protein [Ralstonia solanacearum]MDB0570742.1 hypothetical protein [Ralstonia solanacearum]
MAIPAALVAISLAGCGSSDVRPGDLDYPQLNQNAFRTLEIHGIIESGTPVKFAAHWVSTRGKLWPVADGNCNYMFNRIEGVSSSYTAQIPIVPVIRDDHYSLELKTDAFVPGRCGWKFSGLLVYADGQVFDNRFSVDAAELLVAYNPSLPIWSGMMQSSGGSADISCKTATYATYEAPHSGVYLKCVDTTSKQKLRVTLPEDGSHAFELNIRRGS